MKKYKVYIASPYTNGWMPDNVRLQLQAKHILLDYGFIPFAPLENHFAEIFQARKDKEWLNWDLEWLKVCDIVIRLHTYVNDVELPSPGSDIEIQTAKDNNIPVRDFKSIKELSEWALNMATQPPDNMGIY